LGTLRTGRRQTHAGAGKRARSGRRAPVPLEQEDPPWPPEPGTSPRTTRRRATAS
jgi:hypothetical protein